MRAKGFKRRDLNVKGVSDRRVKEVLKSLTDTGYLDCDGRQGPQGYTYTLAREAEKISLGISLRPPPDNQESGLDKRNTTGREARAQYRPVPDNPDEGDGYREAGESGRSSHRPVETDDLQEKLATGRSGDEKREGRIFPNGQRSAMTVAEVLEEINRLGSGPAKQAELYRRGEITEENAIEWITKAILHRRSEPFEGWQRHAKAVEAALIHPLGCECEECL